ncbi:MAG: glycosyltransferase family 2 protein [Chloroflexota bacterium]
MVATPNINLAPAAAATSRSAVPMDVPKASLEPAVPVSGISIVVPVCNEEGNLRELHHQLLDALNAIALPYEIIFVDDGSRDGTWSVITDLAAQDAHVGGIRHRRNFGKARGLASGFHAVHYDLVITMDGDLQDDPAEIQRFVDAINQGNDLVSGWKQRRKDPVGKTLPSKLFNATVRRVSGVPLNDFNCGFKAYRRDVTENIRRYGELHRFTPVLANAEGFRIAELPVNHRPRTWGSSKYGWSRLPKGFLDLLTVTFLTQYRQRPMHMLCITGLVALAVGIVIGLWLTVDKLVFGAAIGGRPLLLLSVLLVLIGAQFFGLGLLGELLAHGANTPVRQTRVPLRAAIGAAADLSDAR